MPEITIIKRRKFLQISILIMIFSIFCLIEISRLYQVCSTPQRTMNSPLSGRYGHSLVYDPENKQIILFGGRTTDNVALNDLWVYDCKNYIWYEKHVSNKPPARSGHEMIYDSINQKFILFGGSPRYRWSNDTWTYDSTAGKWTEVFPQKSPSPRGSVAMYFDPNLEETILFGGYEDSGEGADETWTYDTVDNTWNLLNLSNKPLPRYGSHLVYDSVNYRAILFGGRIVGKNRLNDTWEFIPSNNSWNQLKPLEGPSTRYWHSMAYDSSNQLIILFGGSGNLGMSQETWIFNVTSDQWIQMNPEVSPPGRALHKMTFDPENEKVVLFGGLQSDYSETYNDTWTYSLEDNNWIMHDPQIIEYSPLPGFNILLILTGLITFYILSSIRKQIQRK